MDAAQFYAFLGDEALSRLIELNKITDDLFDVIKLSENQHSDMLAWLLNPNEGHLQGDAIVKEFLIAAYNASEKHVHDNKKFFEQWTPGRILTTGFGSLFVTREFRVKWDGRQGALDLLLVDPVNEIVVVVENKFGSKLSDQQLEGYVKLVRETLPLGGYFRGYSLAFVYLDAYLEDLSDADRQALSNSWVHLGYDWLKAAADRAQLQLGKNGSAQLLVSYVQKQTTWDSQDEKRRTGLASGLAIRHPDMVSQLNAFSRKKKDSWDGRFLKEDHIREAAFFHAQNEDVCTRYVRWLGWPQSNTSCGKMTS
jgi:hypothetical protein